MRITILEWERKRRGRGEEEERERGVEARGRGLEAREPKELSMTVLDINIYSLTSLDLFSLASWPPGLIYSDCFLHSVVRVEL